MATIVEYNGITLYNVITRKWDEEVVYDQSGTDEIGKKYSFVFQGVLHQQRVPLANSETFTSSGLSTIDEGVGANVFALMSRVTQMLNHPRKTLKVAFGTISSHDVALEIIPAVATAGAMVIPANADLDNGPKPRLVSIVPVGSKAFRITFSVEATVGTCTEKVRNRENAVISNRWSISESMDQDYCITRRISGQLRLAAGLFAAGTNSQGAQQTLGYPGHAYKNLVVPTLENGFKREGVLFTSSPDGLTCTYEVVDRQVHHSAPWPATRMEVVHSESAENANFFTSDCHVRLTGPPNCNKAFLTERVVQILEARLNLTALAHGGDSLFITNFTLTDHLGEQAVIEGHATVNRTLKADTGPKIDDFYDRIGLPLTELDDLPSASSEVDNTTYDYQKSWQPALYGYKRGDGDNDERRPAVLFFLHCYLQDPCSDVRQIGPGQPAEATTEGSSHYEEQATAVYEAPSSFLSYSPSAESFSDETRGSIYTTAEVSTEYHTNAMTVALPIANTNGSPDSPQPGLEQQGQPTARLLHLSQPQTIRIHRVNLERIGLQPAIPEPVMHYQHNGVNAILKDHVVEILTPIRSPDGSQQVYRVLGTYKYLLDRPPVLGEPLPVGINPITNFEGYEGAVKLNLTGNMGVASQPSLTGPQTG
jgi:hypothetical protein